MLVCAVQEAIALIAKFLALEETIANKLCWEFIPGLPYQPYALGVRRILSSQKDMSTQVMWMWMQAGWAFINDRSVSLSRVRST